MNYLTKDTEVKGDISIWAVPRRGAEPDEDPFEYELFTEGNKPWRDGAVKVNTLPVTLMVPAGLNLVQKAVETLKEAQNEILKDANEKVAELEARIGELALLTHQEPPNDDRTVDPAPLSDGDW